MVSIIFGENIEINFSKLAWVIMILYGGITVFIGL